MLRRPAPSSAAPPPASSGQLARGEPPRPASARKPGQTAEAKAKRAAQRRPRQAEARAYETTEGRTFLEARSVTKPVEALYATLMGEFERWAEVEKLPLVTLADRDAALARYATHLFFAGHSASDFSKTRAAAAFKWLDVSKSGVELQRARRAQIGFHKVAPERSRLPIPLLMAAAIANEMVCMNLPSYMPIAVMLQFILYLRPCDVLSLCREELVPPLPLSMGGLGRWSVLLHRQEMGEPSKTGVFDEAMVLDNTEYDDLDQVWAALRSRSGTKLFPMSYDEYANGFTRAIEALQYGPLGVAHLYQLRHGGVSHEVAGGRRPIADAQKRGRWLSAASMRRCEKGGRVAEMLHRLSPAQLEHARICRQQIGLILCGCSPPVRGGRDAASPSSSSWAAATSRKRGASRPS